MTDLQAVSDMAYQAMILTKAIRDDYAEQMSKLTNVSAKDIDARIVKRVKEYHKDINKK